MRWRPAPIKQAILFGELTDWHLNFAWAACQPRIIWNYADAKNVQRKYALVLGAIILFITSENDGKTKAV